MDDLGGDRRRSPLSTSGEVEIRPAVQQMRAFLAGMPLVLIVGAVVLYLRYGIEALLPGAVLSAALLGILRLYLARSRIRMDHLTFSRRGMVTTRSFARADARDVVLAPYQASARDTRVVLTLFVRDQAGRRILRLTSAVWSPADLEMLAHAIGPRPTVCTELLTPAMHEKLHPGSTSVGDRHPGRVRAAITLAMLVTLGAVLYSLST
ncbi:hypothetical protein [Sanguibacter sp. 25GB23B1]|uniref:hypothetical protein n=1 Tax=unclassified Sanguibacter TaxID=2645534 RepID=UPI0032AF111F